MAILEDDDRLYELIKRIDKAPKKLIFIALVSTKKLSMIFVSFLSFPLHFFDTFIIPLHYVSNMTEMIV